MLLALILAISMKSYVWWGNVANDNADTAPNNVTAVVDGVTPDATVSGNVSVTLTCNLPAPSTLRPNGIMIQIDGNNVIQVFGTAAQNQFGHPQTYTVNTANFPDGWHEFRARCFGQDTTSGPDPGKLTELTAGHQLLFSNGNLPASNGDPDHATDGNIDTHSWYDVDSITGGTNPVGYVYSQIKNVHSLIDAPLAGTVHFTGRVFPSGTATIDHWKLMVDDATVAEFHGTTQQRTVPLDTTTLTDGQHTLQFHGHGIAPSGRMLAGQVEIPITVSNGTPPPPPPPPPPPSSLPVSSASDSFAGPLDTTKWTVTATAGSAGASAGVLTITPNTGTDATGVYVTSIPSYTFMGSQASTKVLSVVDGNINNKFTLRAPGNQNEVGWYYEYGNLWAYWRVNGVETDPGFVTYSPTTHAYWRMRQAGTSVFWETSPDGVTYTVQATAPTSNIPFPLDSVQVEFNLKAFSGTGAASAAPAKYSNLNQ